MDTRLIGAILRQQVLMKLKLVFHFFFLDFFFVLGIQILLFFEKFGLFCVYQILAVPKVGGLK